MNVWKDHAYSCQRIELVLNLALFVYRLLVETRHQWQTDDGIRVNEINNIHCSSNIVTMARTSNQ